MHAVSLTKAEMLMAGVVGLMRQAANAAAGRRDAHGASQDSGWQYHIEGALGEYAFSKYAGLFWSGALEFGAADVSGWHVRTRSRHDYDLIVHPSDPDDGRFVLVTGRNGSYFVRGWILGRDAKHERWWQDPGTGRPAFFVPQEALALVERVGLGEAEAS